MWYYEGDWPESAKEPHPIRPNEVLKPVPGDPKDLPGGYGVTGMIPSDIQQVRGLGLADGWLVWCVRCGDDRIGFGGTESVLCGDGRPPRLMRPFLMSVPAALRASASLQRLATALFSLIAVL